MRWNKDKDELEINAWKIGFWVVVAVAFIGALTFAVTAVTLGINTATAGIVGKAKEEQRIESAENRILQQERFETLYNDILAMDRKIEDSQEALDSATDDSDIEFWRETLRGQINHCFDLVAEYNAATEKVSAEQFRDYRLPKHIDTEGDLLDPDLDCAA